jgi:multidrug efflux pump
MRAFTDIFIRHPVLAIVVNLALLLVGWRALTTLPLQQYPSIDSSAIVITTYYTGASAETVRGFVSTPIERVVSAVAGIDHVESNSRAGVSTVTVRLKLDHSATAALAEVNARLQQVRAELPADAEPPTVEVQRADRPFATFYVSFSSSERDVAAITDWLLRSLQPQFATLPGVQRVSFDGGRPLAMRIWTDPDRLAAYQLTPGDIRAALQRNNYIAAVGQAKGDLVQVNLMTDTDLRSAEEFAALVVAERDGAIVRLRDVARVELGAEEPDYIGTLDQREVVYLAVWPQIGANEIEVAHALKAEVERIRPTLPHDVEMRMAYDGSMFMEAALKDIGETLAETVLIVALMVFLFMGSIRTALVPLVAMPVSLVGAGLILYAFGFSLNLLTILAIVLAVGLVVDDAIVVVENVERHLRLGKSRTDAAIAAARELLGPIVAMTITLATVYTPIAFQGGLTGSLFLEFAITLASAVVVSGIVALTLSPVMSAYLVDTTAQESRFSKKVHALFEKLRAGYARRLDAALAMRGAVVIAALLVMIAAVPLYMFSRQELAPVEDQSHISLFFEAAPDSTQAATRREVFAVARALEQFPEWLDVWALAANWGGFGGMDTKHWDKRERSTEEIYGELYAAVSQIPGLRVFPRLDPPLPTPGQYDVELVLQSDKPAAELYPAVAAVLDAGLKSGRFLYVDTDLKIDLPEARLVIDRERLSDLGLDLATVGAELGDLVAGDYVNRFNYYDRSYKVIPQVAQSGRQSLEPLLDLKVRTPGGELVPLSAFTHIETQTAPRALNRFQQRDAVRIFGGVAPGVTKEEGLRVLEEAALQVGGLGIDYAGESRHARLRGGAHLSRARRAFPQLPRSAGRAARLGAAGNLRCAAVHVPRPDHHQHLLSGRPDHAGRIDREERHPHRGVRQYAADAGRGENARAARGLPDAVAAGADDLRRDGVRPPAAGVRVRSRRRGAQQHRHRTGERHGARHDFHLVRGAGVLCGDCGG